MKYYIDCEFDGHNGPLLSIAVVSDDDNGLHIEADVKATDPWVLANVVPLMDQHDAPDCTRVAPNDVGGVIRAYIGEDNEPLIIADSPVDIARFCQALMTNSDGGYEPNAWTRLMFEVHDVNCYPTTLPGAIQHNAWWDAMALKHLMESWG